MGVTIRVVKYFTKSEKCLPLSLAPFITAVETWKSIPGTDCIFTSGTCAEAEMRCPHCRVVGEGVQAAGWGGTGREEQSRREHRVKALDTDGS